MVDSLFPFRFLDITNLGDGGIRQNRDEDTLVVLLASRSTVLSHFLLLLGMHRHPDEHPGDGFASIQGDRFHFFERAQARRCTIHT